ncbi:MAG: FGGY family carbohydrate kinase [Actinobacteria bacterium]|nr:FGGY family carbohydrate kinase [Actinomycetota bacterium]
MSAGLYVGLDLGTSGLKGVVLDGDARPVARAQASYVTHRPERGASEQDPADWIDAIRDVVAALRSSTGDREWTAIGLSGMLPTLVLIDSNAQPLGRAITWEDSRAESEGESLRELANPDAVYARTGQWLDGRYLLPMLLRLQRIDPHGVVAATMLLGAKDYVHGWLTGEFVTDPSTAAGFGCYDLHTGAWDRSILASYSELAGRPAPALPRIDVSTSARPLSSEAALSLGLPAGIPVCLGAADSVLGALGIGVSQPGQAAYIAGTSTIILGVTDHPVTDDAHRFLVTPMAHPGTFGLEMDLLSTGSAVRWLATLLGGVSEAELMQLASTAEPDEVPLFLPYVAPGEQGALWDPSLTGALLGLHLGTTAADIARGLIDGIIVESRRCIRVLGEYGAASDVICASGASASNAWFRQQLADASGHDVVMTDDDEIDGSAVGAALVAAHAVDQPLAPSESRGQLSSANPFAKGGWNQRAVALDDSRARLGRSVE